MDDNDRKLLWELQNIRLLLRRITHQLNLILVMFRKAFGVDWPTTRFDFQEEDNETGDD